MTVSPTPRPPRKRPSPVLIGGVTVALIAGAVAGATAVSSTQTAAMMNGNTATMRQALEATGFAHITEHQYQRGFMSSTETMTVLVGPDEDRVKLKVTNRIQHGPLPGLRTLANAVIDTDVQFADAKVQAAFEKALGGKRPEIRTVIGLTGSTSTSVNVPAGQFADGADMVRWQPLTGTYRASGRTTDLNFALPTVTVSGDGTTVSVNGVRLSGKTTKRDAKDPLGVGDSAFTIDSVSAGDGIGARGIRVSSNASDAGGQFYGGTVKYDVGSVSVPGLNLKNLQLHVSARHLARDPLVRLARAFEAMQQDARQGKATPTLTKAQEDALMADVLALLQGAPVIAVDRLSVEQPSGTVTLDAVATLPDAKGIDAATLKASPEVLLAGLNVRANLIGREQAVRELLTLVDPGGRQGLAANLSGLVEAGMLERRGDNLNATLNYGAGRVTLNGQDLGAF
ncbi:YdgA family protein [Deinococcus maricopensis]|uniref:DUF945 domain-containing protein n=1 Tax=Deinococcus maricopensis (strain DSM 21211 / LMG 22137 / NRRL B-23946 / LB-34) TaxID=709986 RepID=E8U2Y1_DEIML|nr:YdgA family protein [Deinococcus maricopensis]ADV65719.1 protein of unknown function DUF945 [Deinococcus maricopensis DSM 21211]